MARKAYGRAALAGLLSLSLIAAACGDDDDADDATSDTTADGGSAGSGELTPVKFQMQWATQAQFGGYYAARDQGYFEDEGLDVELIESGVDTPPQTVLAQGNVDFAIAWVPKALQTREQGADIVDIAQIFQRSGTLQVSFADAGIDGPGDLEGKNVGNWGFGNEFELFAGMTEAGLDPGTDVTLVQQDFNMQALLDGDIDAAQAMIYNEYAQVLEAENPDTGELYTPDDFSVIDWNDEGTAMLQDAVWADGERLASDEAYAETAVKLLKASIRGWVYCRDNAESCRDIIVASGSQLGDSHQLWQMNEVNKLIWPSPDGIGIINQDDWDRTVEVALNTKNAEGTTVLTAEPDDGAFTNDYIQQALDELEADDLDLTGEDFEPVEVTLEEGGA